jgi:hypothetical protein
MKTSCQQVLVSFISLNCLFFEFAVRVFVYLAISKELFASVACRKRIILVPYDFSCMWLGAAAAAATRTTSF